MTKASSRATALTPGSDVGDASAAGATTIPELMWQQSTALRDRPFLQVWSQQEGVVLTLSFAEFAARVAQAEVALRAQGVQPLERVGMLCHPSAQFFTYALAVLSCGACCVVLNWRQPQEPLVEMSHRAECSHIVAAPPFEEAARLICKSLSLRGVLWLLPPSRSLLEDEAVLPALDGENAPPTRPFSDAKIRHEPTLRPDALAFIMFTSGSTATPKGVPLTHGGLVWLCHQRLAATPDAFSAPHAGTLSLLPNFHVIGLTNNFLFCLFAGVRCAVDREASTTTLTPRRLLAACAALRPSVLDTVPWLAEELIALADRDEAVPGFGASRAVEVLSRLDMIIAGGAPLNSAKLLPLLRKHGVTLWPHYGQTELGGPALMGGLHGSLSAMRPLGVEDGVCVELQGEDGMPSKEQGELVLLGYRSATASYLAGSGGRPLAPPGATTAERFHTGDIFKYVRGGGLDQAEGAAGSTWVEHVCRKDDLLLHSTGEMTNPLPIEAMLNAACIREVAALCVVGQAQPYPFAVVELRDGANPSAARPLVMAAVAAANRQLAVPSRVQHIMYAETPLPMSVKGNVIRGEVERRYAGRMTQLVQADKQAVAQADGYEHDKGGERSSLLDETDRVEEAPSSINLLRAEPAGPTPPMSARAVAVQAARGHMQFLAMMHVMLLHNEPLWGGVRGGIGECRPPCSMLVAWVSDVIYPVAMPTFFALAVLNERRRATKQAVTRLVTLLLLALVFFYVVPPAAERLVAKVHGRLKYVHHYQWFLVLMLLFGCVDLLARLAGVPGWALGSASLAVHFICVGNNCPWPLLRNPLTITENNPMLSYEASGAFPTFAQWVVPTCPFYFLLPRLLPDDFPTSLPGGDLLPGRRSLVAAFWQIAFAAVVGMHALAPPDSGRRLNKDVSPWFLAYGCPEELWDWNARVSCDLGWSASAAAHDALHMLAIAVAVVGFGAVCSLLPRTWLSEAGQASLVVYLVHVPLAPLVQGPCETLRATFPDPSALGRGVAVLVWLAILQVVLARCLSQRGIAAAVVVLALLEGDLMHGSGLAAVMSKRQQSSGRKDGHSAGGGHVIFESQNSSRKRRASAAQSRRTLPWRPPTTTKSARRHASDPANADGSSCTGPRTLVVFLGRVEMWRHTWPSQLALLDGLCWKSIGCLAPVTVPANRLSARMSPESELPPRHQLHLIDLRFQPMRKWHEDDDVNEVCPASSANDKLKTQRVLQKGCLLYRLSSCTEMVLERVARDLPAVVVYLRPDLHFFSSPSVTTAPLGPSLPDKAYFQALVRRASATPQNIARVFARMRCGQNATLQDHPSGLCKRPMGPRCPDARFTIDDQMAILSPAAVPLYFRHSYPPALSTQRSGTCPPSEGWAEGRLTDTLLSSDIQIKFIKNLPGLHAVLHKTFRARWPSTTR